MKEKFLSFVNQIMNSGTVSEIMLALKSFGRKPQSELIEEKAEQSSRKTTRVVLAVVAILMIGAITCFAWLGGNYIFSYGGSVALFFGVLDIMVVLFLSMGRIKNAWRYVAVGFEVVSLLYLGYAMSGYFGGGNLKNATERQLSAMYEVSEQYRDNTQSIINVIESSAIEAGNIRDAEINRNGRGIVAETADLISKMQPAKIGNGTLAEVPVFLKFIEANKWLDGERRLMITAITDYKSQADAMKRQAESSKPALISSVAIPSLSMEQKSNLEKLLGLMNAITSAPVVSVAIPEGKLTQKDLRSDGFQSYIGYLVDLVVVILILLIALQKRNPSALTKMKEQEILAFIREVLDMEGINYSQEALLSFTCQKQIEGLRSLIQNENLFAYVKKNMSFEGYLTFVKDYPVLTQTLAETKWSFSEIKKELERNQEFVNIAGEALLVSPADWNLVKKIGLNINQLLQLEKDTRDRFLRLVGLIQTKTKMKNEELNTFVSQFLYQGQISSESFETLETCVTRLDGNRIKDVTPDFAKTANKETAAQICLNAVNPNQFKRIVDGWNENLNDDFESMLSNGVSKDPHFGRFIKNVINRGGVDGIKSAIKSYKDKHQEAQATTIGDKEVALSPDFSAIEEAVKNQNDTAFLEGIANAFVLKSSVN